MVIALTAATVALWLAFTLDRWWERAFAALVMAVAICGMHYTGMAATAILPGPDVPHAGITLSEPVLAAIVTLGVFAIVLIGLVSAFYDRRREADAVLEAERLRKEVERRTAELQVASDYLDAALKRAEKASAAKSDFLASMSHELRTPMNAILGFTQLLLSGRNFEPLSTEQSGAVQQIDMAGRHLLHLIDEILDLSRIEAGRMTMSIEAVEVLPLIEEVTSMLQPAAIEAGVTIHTSVPRMQVSAKADRRRLQQVLINLVSNAVKYNRRGGEVAIRCRVVDGGVRIAVRDNGSGIPEQYMSELFEPFNRLAQEQSEIAGNGVGLALCKRLVENMFGEIRVNSQEGVGSIFVVTLPLAADAARHSVAPRKKAILYIEDNPSNVLLMRHIVKGMNDVELVVATRPREGIELARNIKPALILLDINLPELDGFEVLRILKSDAQTASIPVFALTANAMPREVKRGKEAGFQRYITKPLDVAQLVDAINETLSPSPSSRRFRKYAANSRSRVPEILQKRA